jgi:hypothetical protein
LYNDVINYDYAVFSAFFFINVTLLHVQLRWKVAYGTPCIRSMLKFFLCLRYDKLQRGDRGGLEPRSVETVKISWLIWSNNELAILSDLYCFSGLYLMQSEVYHVCFWYKSPFGVFRSILWQPAIRHLVGKC